MACAICARPVDPRYRPFCSKLCADIDLAKWLRGDYVVPGESVEDLPPRDEEPAPCD